MFYLPAAQGAQDLEQRWQTFYQQSWQAVPLTISQAQLSQFPSILLKDDAQYPNFDKVSWQEIESLSLVVTACSAPADLSPDLHYAVEFETRLCQGKTIPLDWFARHPLLHPAGGSFADRYLIHHPELPVTPALTRYLTLHNAQHPLHQSLSGLSGQGRDALLNGYQAWLEKETLWLSSEQGWKALSKQIWRPIADNLGITLRGDRCVLDYSNLCVSDTKPRSPAMMIVITLLSIAIVCMALRTAYLKRLQNKEKQFVLQLLTHELRTPITSLGLTVEMFREQFDQLPVVTQDAVWRLMSDHQRLFQLTENSQVYLSAHGEDALLKQTASVKNWLSHVCEKHGLEYTLNQDKQLTLPFYWLSICLDNLIKNAKQHGRSPIEITATLSEVLRIEIKDHGQFPNIAHRWFKRIHPPSRNENMGVGLSIVAHLMTLMGGKLHVRRHPTRCLLELPL
ncbi:DUF3404 domain-containing protein [Vibrio ostreicida]|uniref:ATP-binding protein n=1 Tax=Vibrio ostreicida TaxID=526588 RepID=UPI003B5BCE64